MEKNTIQVKIEITNYDEIVEKVTKLKELLQDINNTDVEVKIN